MPQKNSALRLLCRNEVAYKPSKFSFLLSEMNRICLFIVAIAVSRESQSKRDDSRTPSIDHSQIGAECCVPALGAQSRDSRYTVDMSGTGILLFASVTVFGEEPFNRLVK